MSDIEDIKDTLTLEFIEAVENRKKTMKNRNEDFLTMIDFEFSKSSSVQGSCFLFLRINENRRAMSYEH